MKILLQPSAFLILILFQIISVQAWGQEEIDPDVNMDNTFFRPYSTANLPLWEAGFLGTGITQPAYPGADQQASLLFGLPFVIYRGEYLRVDRGAVGVRAIKTPRVELDVGFAASLGSKSDNIEARRGMSDLGTLLEFGPRLRINLGDVSQGKSSSRIQIPVRGVFDANDRFRFKGIAYELQWVKDMELPNRWVVTSNIGALFGNDQLAGTFYGVAEQEVTSERAAYVAKGGLIATRATILASRLMNKDIRFVTYVRLDSVKGAENYRSPLVRRDQGWTVGVGMSWTLSRSDRYAVD